MLVNSGLRTAEDGQTWCLLAPISENRASYSPLIFFISIALFMPLVFSMVRCCFHARFKRVPALHCGFSLQTSRMQDTAEGFGQPILTGWVNQCRAWWQNRSAPPLLQSYYTLSKLMHKDVLLAHNASFLFRAAPYIIFSCMALAAAIVPPLSTDLFFSPAEDVIALVGLFALARVFIALAGMDVGTSFGSRSEMLIGFLVEPALLMVFFTASLISQSTSLSTIVEMFANSDFVIYPSLAFSWVAFTIVSLAENARIPFDNPTTHLELTMVHAAMVLEYSRRHLALIEWAASLKLFAYSCLGIALFFPFGISQTVDPLLLLAAAFLILLKLTVGGFLLALIETVNAKMRVFRAPEFLGTAFLLAVLAMLVHLLLETGQ